MLDDRKAAILSAVVREYITTAQPVGSTHIADAPGVGVSPATVRNELAVLEQEGFLAQPHTSAGRIPTDKGYRFFVDRLAAPGHLDDDATMRVGQFFMDAHGRLEETLHRTSDLLASLTNYAALVVGPKSETVAVRSVQMVGVSPTLATVVVVLSNGSVENETVHLGDDVTDSHLAAATGHLSAALAGDALSSAAAALKPSGDPIVDRICDEALTALRSSPSDDHVWVGGTSSVAAAFDAVEVVREVLFALEQQFIVVSLVSDIVQRGMSVAIGVEHGVEPLSACSIVVSPVVVDGEHVGSVGVLGPTRMNYPQALATVDVVSERLGRRLRDY
ncbi:MAG: heat-inducible transcriptional repressor HrcA [Ilumatobacteraceae bacterium]